MKTSWARPPAVLCFAAFLAVLLSACAAALPARIRVGVFEPLSGVYAAGGSREVEGIGLANRLYPRVKLGGGEYPVELVVADNRSDKVETVNAVERLVESEHVVALLGSWGSSLSIAAGSAVRDHRVPAIALSCTNPLVTKGNDYYFRVCFLDSFQGRVMARYAAQEAGAARAVVLREASSEYSVGSAQFFMDGFRKLTGDQGAVLAELNYGTGETDFGAQLQTIRALHPDLVFAPGNCGESALLIRQARALGIRCPFLGGDSWENPAFIALGGRAVEGAVFPSFFAAEVALTPTSAVFLQAYRERYGREPAAASALGFDAYLLLLDALQRAGSTEGRRLRDALAATRDYPGAAGLISFDANRDAIKSVALETVKDGRFSYLATVQP